MTHLLCYMGHILMENRTGLVVDTETTITSGTAEREAVKDHDPAQHPEGQSHTGCGQGL